MGRFTAEGCLPILIEHLNTGTSQYCNYNHRNHGNTVRDASWYWNITILRFCDHWYHGDWRYCDLMCRFTAEGCHPGSPIKQCWFITILLYFNTGTII